MSNTEINKLLDSVVSYLYGFGDGGDCCPSYDDAQEFKHDMERVKELIAEKDSEIAALKRQDNWIPIEDKSQLIDGLRCIIQDSSNDVFEAVYNNKIWCHTFNNDYVFSDNSKDHVKYYQPLPEPKK